MVSFSVVPHFRSPFPNLGRGIYAARPPLGAAWVLVPWPRLPMRLPSPLALLAQPLPPFRHPLWGATLRMSFPRAVLLCTVRGRTAMWFPYLPPRGVPTRRCLPVLGAHAKDVGRDFSTPPDIVRIVDPARWLALALYQLLGASLSLLPRWDAVSAFARRRSALTLARRRARPLPMRRRSLL